MNAIHRCEDKQEWDDYVLENDGHPLQLWGWGEVKAANGWKTVRLQMRDEDGAVLGAAQVLIRKLPWPFRSIAYVPRGPIVDNANRGKLLSELEKYVKNSYNSVVLTVEPDSKTFDVPTGWKKSKNHILPPSTIIVDLNKTEEELLSDMETSTRRYIRKSSEEAIAIKMIKDKEGLDDCLKVYKETANRAKFNLHKEQYYHDVFEKLGEFSALFVAYCADKPVAFLWLAISSDISFELYGGMNDDGRQVNASYALKWHAIRKCREWGLKRYDFGGLVSGGVSSFKKSWTDTPTEMAGTFDKPLFVFYGLWSVGLPGFKSVFRKVMSLIGKK